MGQIKNYLFFGAYLFLNPSLWRVLLAKIPIQIYVQYQWLNKYKIKTVIDVGAYRGEVAKVLNYLFPEAIIYAFEPLKENCRLIRNKINPQKLILSNLALSNKKGEAVFYRYQNLSLSSLLPLKKKMKVGKMKVKTTTLDDYFKNKKLAEKIFLKIDTQGTEKLILEGGKKLLKKVAVIHLEASFRKLYQNQSLFNDIHGFLTKQGFRYFGEIEEAEFYPFFGLRDQKNTVFMRI